MKHKMLNILFKRKMPIILGIVVALFLLTFLVEAKVLPVIEMPDSFKANEKAYFNYTITSDSQTKEKVRFQVSVFCPQAPVPFIEEKTKEADKDNPIKGTYQIFTVKEEFEPQTCTVYLAILEPTYQKTEKQFEIKTKPSFDIQILSCKDKDCRGLSKVFVKGEEVYFDFTSQTPEIEVKAKLTAPDNSNKNLSLPVNVTLNQVGSYTLETQAQKEGYKTNIQTIELAVLSEAPKAIDDRICNLNGICELERGEIFQTCPQDCPSSTLQQPWLAKYFWQIFIFLTFTITIGVCYYSKYRKEKNSQ